MTLSTPLKVSVCKPEHIITLPVNSREACGLVALIFDSPYWTLFYYSLFTLDLNDHLVFCSEKKKRSLLFQKSTKYLSTLYQATYHCIIGDTMEMYIDMPKYCIIATLLLHPWICP